VATLNDRRGAAQRALANLDVLAKVIPARDRENPHELAAWLRAAAQMNGLRPVDHEAVIDAIGLVDEWRDAASQSDAAARLYHDPRIQKAAKGLGKDVDWFWQRPAEAAKALINLKYTNPGLLDAKLLDRATDAALAAQMHNEESGIDEPDPHGPVPTNETQREAEITELTQKAIRGKLTPLEDARYDQLLQARVNKEQAAEDKALADYKAGRATGGSFAATAAGRPQPAGQTSSIDELIQKSIRGRLSVEEDTRLDRLLHAREVAAGRIEPAPGADPADTGYEIDAGAASQHGGFDEC
jgi:hypothetical protein